MKKTLIALMALAGVSFGDTYWSFEGTTSSAGDNAYVGKITNTVTMQNTTATTGSVLGNDSNINLGYTMKFENKSYIQYDNASIVSQLAVGTGASDFTVMAYVTFNSIPNGDNDSNVFFFGTGTGHNGIALGVKDDGKIDFLVKGVNHYTWDVTPESGTWYHLAYAYDASANSVELFINGASKGSVTLGNYSSPANTIMIGASGNLADAMQKFDGQIAHLQIITGEALGADAVVQYASNIIPEPTTATLSLLALCGLAARRRRR